MAADPPVTIMVSRKVPPANRPAFDLALHAITERSSGFPGHLGVSVLRPAGADDVYRILFRFDRKSRFDDWQADAGIQDLRVAADALTDGEPKIQTTEGLEAWFSLPGTAMPPPRHKMALTTWAALFPLVSLLLTGLDPVLKQVPFLVGTVLVTGLVTVLMTYVVMPRLTRLLAGWLFRR